MAGTIKEETKKGEAKERPIDTQPTKKLPPKKNKKKNVTKKMLNFFPKFGKTINVKNREFATKNESLIFFEVKSLQIFTGKKNKGPCHFTLKCILRQKKNYENSNISPCKNIIFKTSL
jgi:hypothetical protein